MYKFEDTVQKIRVEEDVLPISAMNYDGVFLEDLIDGYRTLVVTGREMISVDIQSDNRNIGAIISSQRIPPRTLKVEYQIRNDDPEMLIVNYRYLVEALYREKDVPIYFNDERDVFYYGRFSASDEVPGNSYMFTASFEIFCADPRKYTYKKYEVNSKIMSRFPYKTNPLSISINIKNNGKLIVSNGEKNIKITTHELTAGDKVIFDFPEGEVLVNGINRTNWLDLTSDFENFYLNQGQTITCTNGEMIIEYREVSL